MVGLRGTARSPDPDPPPTQVPAGGDASGQLPGPVQGVRGDAVNAYQWQRVRFGILAARHEGERARLTPTQVEDLEALEVVGWRVGNAGTVDAYNHEWEAIRKRN